MYQIPSKIYKQSLVISQVTSYCIFPPGLLAQELVFQEEKEKIFPRKQMVQHKPETFGS